MMKVEELMVGDWVHWQNRSFDPGQWCNMQIVNIIKDGKHYYTHTDIGCDEFYPEELSPILITPEILERNGFNKEEWTTSSWKRYLGYNRWCDMSTAEDKWYIRIKKGSLFTCLKEIRYVHNLQHLFREYDIEQEWKIEQND